MSCPVRIPTGFARVRFIHNVASTRSINFYVEDKEILQGIPYKTISDYARVAPGKRTFYAVITGTKSIVSSAQVDLMTGKDFTIILHGSTMIPSSIKLLSLQDLSICPKENLSFLRFIHAAAVAPNVDVYCDDKIIFRDIPYPGTGLPEYVEIIPGHHNVSILRANTRDIVLGPLSLTLDGRKVYTITASGVPANFHVSYPLTVLLSMDNNGVCDTQVSEVIQTTYFNQ